MTHPDDQPVEDVFVSGRSRAEQFKLCLEQLRSGDPTFAEASALYPDDTGEWQAAVYLLTGSDQVWTALADGVLRERSIAPAISELEAPRRAWSSSEGAVMQWAVHFWDVGRWPARFPYVFEAFYFRRWISACHLYKRISPALPISNAGAP